MAVRQGALRLRDLDEDTTGELRGGNFPKYSCVLIITHNSLAGVEMSLCGDSVNK